MEQAKKIIRAVFFPKTAAIVFCAVLAAILLIYTFAFYCTNGWIAYVSYFFSSYALIIVCIRLCSIRNSHSVKRMKDSVLEIANNNSYIGRYMTDVVFKTKVSLLLSLILNIGYAVLKMIAGVLYSSTWFITLATYYILLLTMRSLLLRHINKNMKDLTME